MFVMLKSENASSKLELIAALLAINPVSKATMQRLLLQLLQQLQGSRTTGDQRLQRLLLTGCSGWLHALCLESAARVDCSVSLCFMLLLVLTYLYALWCHTKLAFQSTALLGIVPVQHSDVSAHGMSMATEQTSKQSIYQSMSGGKATYMVPSGLLWPMLLQCMELQIRCIARAQRSYVRTDLTMCNGSTVTITIHTS